ncbi:hypothetical protein GOP47_0003531 [Adiantum capillus-veneris]|uniref:Uncharacterized protein n=1 Tax=Adiantum capillus-veneris TaxID=13818 RepID=A0A9D4VCM2_ADICA|nr:hypothetical protein GOP47_0003531 [Adiantum capillus-veneris]
MQRLQRRLFVRTEGKELQHDMQTLRDPNATLQSQVVAMEAKQAALMDQSVVLPTKKVQESMAVGNRPKAVSEKQTKIKEETKDLQGEKIEEDTSVMWRQPVGASALKLLSVHIIQLCRMRVLQI